MNNMQEQSNQMIDLSSNYFTVPENDRYVDFFFTDQREDPLIQSNLNQQLYEDRLFPQPPTNPQKNSFKLNAYSSNQQEKKLQTKKKMKNTYASKIAKLIHEEEGSGIKNGELIKEEDAGTVKEEEHGRQHNFNYFEDIDRQSDQLESSSDKKQEKLMKNRLSAQKSRKIKKEYMEILEDRVNELQEQLEFERKNNEKNMEKLKKYSYHEAILNGYFISRDQMMEKLQEAIKNKSSIEQLSILLDSLKFRFSGCGKERMNIIRYYYEQIFDLMVPDLTKYVIYSASKGIGIFNNLSSKQPSEMMKVMDLKSEKQYHVKAFRESLIQSKQTISEIASQLVAAKEKLDKEVRKIDDIFEQIRNVMNIESEIKCILFLEKNKYKPEYNAAWKQWKNVNPNVIQIFLDCFDKDNSQPKKMMKLS